MSVSNRLSAILPWFSKPSPTCDAASSAHEHTWFACFAQEGDGFNPPASVADCNCGARALIFPGPGGLPEIRIEAPNPGGSIANCLVVNNESALGDPQGQRLALLNAS